MEITANQVFLHGGTRYEAGETYDVEPDLAGYFVHNGWATSPAINVGPPSAPAEVDLDVHSVHHEAKTEGP